MIPHRDFLVVLLLFFFLKYLLHIKCYFCFLPTLFFSFLKTSDMSKRSVCSNKNYAFEVYDVFAVYHLGFSSKQFQYCNKSLINQACSGPYWENIGPWSFLYGPSCARFVLSRPRADILPIRPSRLVNKIYISNKGEWINCFSKFSNRVLPPIFISTILQSEKSENF